MVPAYCLDFCDFGEAKASEFAFEWEHLNCLQHLEDVTGCMQEGLGELAWGDYHGDFAAD